MLDGREESFFGTKRLVSTRMYGYLSFFLFESINRKDKTVIDAVVTIPYSRQTCSTPHMYGLCEDAFSRLHFGDIKHEEAKDADTLADALRSAQNAVNSTLDDEWIKPGKQAQQAQEIARERRLGKFDESEFAPSKLDALLAETDTESDDDTRMVH